MPPAPPVLEVAPGLIYAGALARIVAYVIDIILIGVATLAVLGVLAAVFPADQAAAYIAYTVLASAVELVYFVGFWTASSRATLGMRVLKLQIGNAADGRTLRPEQAVRRWVALGFPLTLLGLVPVLAGAASGVYSLWLIVLTISMATSPTKQGIHDRFARSAVVQPAGASNAVVVGCLVLVGILVVLPLLVLVVALVFLGGQLSTLLSEIGSSI